MKLGIKNFAKIKAADIIIDGITVIAGENNTGKSTVGKILFSLFNALSDIDEKIFAERWRAIERANRRTIQNYISNLNISRSMVSRTAFHVTEPINMWIRKALSKGKEITFASISDIVDNSLKNWM